MSSPPGSITCCPTATCTRRTTSTRHRHASVYHRLSAERESGLEGRAIFGRMVQGTCGGVLAIAPGHETGRGADADFARTRGESRRPPVPRGGPGRARQPGRTMPRSPSSSATIRTFYAAFTVLEHARQWRKGIGWKTGEEIAELAELRPLWRNEGTLPRIATQTPRAKCSHDARPRSDAVAVRAWEVLRAATGAHTLFSGWERDAPATSSSHARSSLRPPGLESGQVSYNANVQLPGAHRPPTALPGPSRRPPRSCLLTPRSCVAQGRGEGESLNFITPHQKWGIPST